MLHQNINYMLEWLFNEFKKWPKYSRFSPPKKIHMLLNLISKRDAMRIDYYVCVKLLAHNHIYNSLINRIERIRS